LLLGLVFATFLNQEAFAFAAFTTGTTPDSSAGIPHLGTVDDYVNGSQETSCTSYVLIFGMSVMEGTAKLQDGHTVHGVRICFSLRRSRGGCWSAQPG
jgi:hypothetical protein